MKSTPSRMLSLAAENCAVVMAHAHSFDSFRGVVTSLKGEQKQLRKLLFELPELKADRALLEMAVLLRAVDDVDQISQVLGTPFGTLHLNNGATTPLSLRDVANKIIHASRFKWELSDPDNLHVVCKGEQGGNWSRAEILIDQVAIAFGRMAI